MLSLPLLIACASPSPSSLAEAPGSATATASAVIDKASLDLLGDARGQAIESPDDLMHMYTATAMGDRVLAAGTGGLTLVDVRSGSLEMVSRLTGLGVVAENPFVAAVGERHAIVSAQDPTGFKTGLIAIDDDGRMTQVGTFQGIEVPSAVAEYGDALLILETDGELWLWDRSSDPKRILDGLFSPRDLAVVGDFALIAERETGLTVVNLNSRAIVNRVETRAAPLDVQQVGETLYVAEGSFGVEVFDLSIANAPRSLGYLQTPGTAQELALDDETLWVAAMSGLAAVDVRNPQGPWVAGFSAGEEFTLGVVPTPHGAVAVDWSYLHLAERVGEASPVLELSQSEVVLNGEGAVRLTNLGTRPLALGTAEVSGEGATIGSLPPELAPGETAELTLDVAQGADAEIRFSSSDPDLAEVVLPVHGGSGVELSVGQQAPAVRLRDLDGQFYDRELVNRPVVLVFFATWCPICPPELDDLEAMAETLDAEVWLVSSEDDRATLEAFREARGLTLPILIDEDGSVHDQFRQVSAFEQTLYPQNWIVGVDGTIVYAANHYEPEAIASAVQYN